MAPSTEIHPSGLGPAAAGSDGNPLIPAILAFFLVGGQIYLIAARGFANVLETPFLPYCFLGAFAIHVATKPGRFESAATLGLGGVCGLGFVFLRNDFRWTWPNGLAAVSSIGLASLVVLAFEVAKRRGESQQQKLNTLIAGSVFAYSALFIAFILNLTTTLHPKTYDLYLYLADTGFGIPIAASAGIFLRHHSTLSWWCGLVYESLPLAISLVYAWERSGRKPLHLRVLPAFLGGGAAAYLLYNILPAAGPLYIFGSGFPNHLPRTVQAALQAPLIHEAPRNAVPSMHLVCALLIFWTVHRLSGWAYLVSAAYLVLTILATLGLGEHYVVDLLAAVPYALTLEAVCAQRAFANRASRKQALTVGLALTVLWIAGLRFAPVLFQSAAFAWPAALFTVVVCWVSHCRLAPASR